MLESWILSTAWPMTPPVAYGMFHLLFLILGLGGSTAIAWALRRGSAVCCRRVLLGVGLLLICCETYKLLFYYYVLGHGSFQWWVFPFQLCSIPMYLCLLANLVRSETVRRTIYTFLCTYNLLGGFLALLEPSGLSHEYWTLTMHGFLWHTLLVFLGLLLLISGNGPRSFRDFRRATVLFLLLRGMAFCINLALFRVSGGEINMFFIGPANNPLIVFSEIAARFGWYAATAVYIPCVCLGAWLIYIAVRLLTRRRRVSEAESTQEA